MPDIDPIPTEETTPTDAQPAEVTQEPAPMLDVHPAHHAASTWKDFGAGGEGRG